MYKRFDKIDWILLALAFGVGLLLIFLGYAEKGLHYIPAILFWIVTWIRDTNKKKSKAKSPEKNSHKKDHN
ncbi:hypothetical protein D0466_19865 [Peribacillus glennii]|uniref:Uncharacterized protein n=1 Tax=Peribacillus glennii TaxID=2303991 RepID=A0A372L923_9BACI|nr:hypothetical protein D0466_19865 [Peribacillus glennii]